MWHKGIYDNLHMLNNKLALNNYNKSMLVDITFVRKSHYYCHGRASVGTNIIHRLVSRKLYSHESCSMWFPSCTTNRCYIIINVYEYDINGKAMIETCFGINMCATAGVATLEVNVVENSDKQSLA